MNLAIIAGLGLIGSYIIDDDTYVDNRQTLGVNSNNDSNNIKLFPSDINKNTQHVYSTMMQKNIDSNFYQLAENQKEKSEMPARTNVIPPYFNKTYEDPINRSIGQIAMGPVPSYNLTHSDAQFNSNTALDSQFNLPMVDNMGDPASVGDVYTSIDKGITYNMEKQLAMDSNFSPFNVNSELETYYDMTYGITDKNNFVHNNMIPNTSRRDDYVDESNNFEYPMEIFTGSSKNWNPKRETIPFFSPEEFKETPFGSEIVTQEARDRIIPNRSKQNERPFEPITVAPGVGLDYNDMPQHGFHDTTRIMPKDVDDLRTTNKRQISYNLPTKAVPKKGSKRGISAPVIKRRPKQFKEQSVDDFVTSKSTFTAPKSKTNFDLKTNARTVTTCETKGNPVNTTRVGGTGTAGKVKISKRVTHVEDKLGPKGPNQYSTNTKSYNILETERETTNYNEFKNPNNRTQGHKKYDPNDKAKQTIRETTNAEFNTTLSKLVGSYSNLSDNAKQTIKQVLATQTFEQIMNSAQHNVYANFNDEAKQTLKEVLTLCKLNSNLKSNSSQTYSNWTDKANTTLKEILTVLNTNTMIKPNQHTSYSNLTDKAKTTIKETLSESELNTFIAKSIGSYTNLDDEAKHTIKEILSTQPLQTMINSAKKESYTNLSDEAKTTLKQLLTLQTYSTFIKQNSGTYSNLTDEAKATLKQLLTSVALNTNIKSSKQQTYSNLMDLAKTTIKEFIATTELNTNMGTVKKSKAFNQNDVARPTQKEDMLNDNYLGGMIDSSNGTQQVSFNIDPTMKDLTKIVDYQGIAGAVGINNKPKSQSDARNMVQNTNKEIIAKGRKPTLSGLKQAPTQNEIGEVRYKAYPTYNHQNAPKFTSKTNLNDRSLFRKENTKTAPYYDERLYEELLEQLQDNELSNNVHTNSGSHF